MPVSGAPSSIAAVVDQPSGVLTMHANTGDSFNLADPSDPVALGMIDVFGIEQLKRGADDQLIAERGGSAWLLEVSSSGAPVVVDRLINFQLQGDVSGASLGGGIYIMAGPQHFSLMQPAENYDFSSEIAVATPVGLGTGNEPAYVAARDGAVFVIDEADGSLVSIDVSDPEAPVVLDTFGGGFLNDLDFHGDLLYAMDESLMVSAIDITDPASLTLINSWQPQFTESARGVGPAGFIDVDGDSLLVCNGSSVAVYGIPDPMNPEFLDVLSDFTLNGISEFDAQGGIAAAYASYFHGGGELGQIYTIDYTDPSAIFLINQGFASRVRDLKVIGGSVQAMSRNTDFEADVSQLITYDSQQVSPISELDFSSEEKGVSALALGVLEVSGDRMYAPTGRLTGIAVFDVSDPLNPGFLGTTGVAEQDLREPSSIAIDGDRLYIVDGWNPDIGIYDRSTSCLVGCPSDLTGDGLLDFFDISAFLSAFGAMDPDGDFNNDGLYDFFDISGFLSAFSEGCP